MNIGNYGIIRWAAWYLSKGQQAAVVLRRMMERWGHLFLGEGEDLLRQAQSSLTVAQRFQRAEGSETLLELTGGAQPPGEAVSVTIAYGWKDASGRQHYASVKVPTQWGASRDEVLESARELFSQLALDYDVTGVPTWSVVGGIWTPADTQL